MNVGNFGTYVSHRSPKRKRGRRSFTGSAIPEKVSFNFSKKNRIGPEPLKFPECDIKDFVFGDREKENFSWCFLRNNSIPQQIVPSWTGFNINIHNGTPVLKSSVHYLNSLDAPATELSTIYQVNPTPPTTIINDSKRSTWKQHGSSLKQLKKYVLFTSSLYNSRSHSNLFSFHVLFNFKYYSILL